MDIHAKVDGALKRIKERKDKVKLYTFKRAFYDDGVPEYICRARMMDKSDLPREAVHVTGSKRTYAVVDMDPNYPEYFDQIHFDAKGYFWYFFDGRIQRGYDAVGELAEDNKFDLKTIAMVGVGLVVAVWVLMKVF